MSADIDIADRLLDLRHVAGDALAARAAGLVVGVRLDRGRARTVGRARPMTIQADLARGLPQHRRVVGAVDIMATEAGHTARIHHALHEIVALHAILVGGAIGEMREGLYARLVLFQLPEIAEALAHREPNRPVVI